MVSLKFFPRGDPSARTKCLALARDQILRVLSDEGGNAIESVQALLLPSERYASLAPRQEGGPTASMQ